MSHGSDDSDNYWPGYVDALTSMVQVLAFVMMMLAMAVFVLSQSVSKHAVEAIAQAVNAEVKPNSDMKQVMQAVMDKIQGLQSSDSSKEASRPQSPASKRAIALDPATDPRPEKIAGMRVSSMRPNIDPVTQSPADAPRLTVGFDERSFRIDQERAQSLALFVGENKVVEQSQALVVNAYAYSGDGALSEARRLAYYRAMMARKQLVDQKVRPEGIRINVNDTADKDKGSTVEIIIAGRSAH